MSLFIYPPRSGDKGRGDRLEFQIVNGPSARPATIEILGHRPISPLTIPSGAAIVVAILQPFSKNITRDITGDIVREIAREGDTEYGLGRDYCRRTEKMGYLVDRLCAGHID